MSVINPNTKRSIKIGSATYNKLVRDGVIKEKKKSVKKISPKTAKKSANKVSPKAAKKSVAKQPSPVKPPSPKKIPEESWIMIYFYDSADDSPNAFLLREDKTLLYHNKEDAIEAVISFLFPDDEDEKYKKEARDSLRNSDEYDEGSSGGSAMAFLRKVTYQD